MTVALEDSVDIRDVDSFESALGHAAPPVKATQQRILRTIRVGLLGLGNVGQALVRVSERFAAAYAAQGIELRFTAALVRSRTRPREAVPAGALVTDQPAEFLAADFDVVVEVLGGVEPANTLVRRVLRAGVPVVTANKSLLAAHGAELRRIARRSGATLRVEASAIAGVPFLGTHARRPLAACVDRITAILNGTSNYIVSRVAAGATFAAALAEAQARGYAEPDPTNDVAGIDAAEKLAVILGELDVAALAAPEIERTRLDQIGPGDLALAAALGGTVRPVAHAQLADGAVSAFVGPAFVAGTHRLARIDGVENAIELHGPAIGTLFYTGPGAGPDVTAATILDDIFEIASQPTLPRGADAADGLPPVSTVTPGTAWFVRLAFPVREPAPPWVFEFLSGYGLWVRRSAQHDGTLGLLVFPCQRERITAALDALREATGIHAAFCRALEE